MPDDKYLDIQNLDAGYGRSQVLFGINMSVPWRGGVAVLGRNGAGKTTLMKAIIGELPLLGGSVTLDARDVSQVPTEQRIRLGFGYVPQEHSVFGRLSVRDNLAVGALTNRDSHAVNRILEIFPKLGQRMDQIAGTLSAENARCWRSDARYCLTRGCCCWTSPQRASGLVSSRKLPSG